MKRILKIFVLIIVIIIIGFIISTYKYQQLVNDGSAIADEECLKVNPLIIARRNSYKEEIDLMVASASGEEVINKIAQYFDNSQKYLTVQTDWLKNQKSYMDRSDFKFFVPQNIQAAARAQFTSREADAKITELLIRDNASHDTEEQKNLNTQSMEQISKRNAADDEYDKLWEAHGFDLRDIFVKTPPTKCPPENFNIPEVPNIFAPPIKPSNNNS